MIVHELSNKAKRMESNWDGGEGAIGSLRTGLKLIDSSLWETETVIFHLKK